MNMYFSLNIQTLTDISKQYVVFTCMLTSICRHSTYVSHRNINAYYTECTNTTT